MKDTDGNELTATDSAKASHHRVQSGKRLAALGGKAPDMKATPRRRPRG